MLRLNAMSSRHLCIGENGSAHSNLRMGCIKFVYVTEIRWDGSDRFWWSDRKMDSIRRSNIIWYDIVVQPGVLFLYMYSYNTVNNQYKVMINDSEIFKWKTNQTSFLSAPGGYWSQAVFELCELFTGWAPPHWENSLIGGQNWGERINPLFAINPKQGYAIGLAVGQRECPYTRYKFLIVLC